MSGGRMKTILVLLVILVSLNSKAVNAESCGKTLDRIKFFAVSGDEDAFPFVINKKGEVLNEDTREVIPFKAKYSTFKTIELRDYMGNKISTSFKYEGLNLKQIESSIGSAKYTASFDDKCNLMSLTRNKEMKFDSRLCDEFKKVGMRKISECNMAMSDLAKAINKYKSEIKSDGYTYTGFSNNEVRAEYSDEIMKPFVACDYVNKWYNQKTGKYKDEKPSANGVQ